MRSEELKAHCRLSLNSVQIVSDDAVLIFCEHRLRDVPYLGVLVDGSDPKDLNMV